MSDFRKLRGLQERGDPVGPPLEELEQREKLRLLKEGRRNFDPKLGGSPVFRPVHNEKRVIWQRYPRAWIYGVALFTVATFYGPFIYSWFQSRSTPLTELERKEAQIVNNAIDRKYADKWYHGLILRAREK